MDIGRAVLGEDLAQGLGVKNGDHRRANRERYPKDRPILLLPFLHCRSRSVRGNLLGRAIEPADGRESVNVAKFQGATTALAELEDQP